MERFALDDKLSAILRHVWVARWALPEGETSRQRVLAYPTFNAVFMPGVAAVYGPEPRLQIRELTGTGWAVGLLLQPAAGSLLSPVRPKELFGKSLPLANAPTGAVAESMLAPDHQPAVSDVVTGWLAPLASEVDPRGEALNQICRLAEEDPRVVTVIDLAERVDMSPRSLERLVRSRIGVTPKWLIECRRLQHAATTLYGHEATDLTELALSLGYVDYAHFSRRYKAVLGETPEQTRALGRTEHLQPRSASPQRTE